MYRLTVVALVAIFAVGCQGDEFSARNRNASNTYYIYTRDNARTPVQIFPNAVSVIQNSSIFRPYTAIVVHGHQGSGFTSLNPVVKDAFLSGDDVTVIVVDWSSVASLNYREAVNSVPDVGQSIAQVIRLLVQFNRVSLDRLHLIGFDLGAHVVGFTGRNLSGQVARITGLDPSGSRWGSNSGRLTVTDARYVEVLHTDGDGLKAIGIGTALGHVDFFANGGGNQPGCLLHSCSHNRAWEFFAASLTHNHLIGNLCSSDLQLSLNRCRGYALQMGSYALVKYGSGIFRVNTGRTYPY